MKTYILTAIAVIALTACDQIGQKLGPADPAKQEERLETEATAAGSACRQSGRAIEDCYSIYGWLPKAGIYAGWREMDEYMRENKLETVAPQLPPPEPPGAKRKAKKETTENATASDAKAEVKTEPKADSEKKADKH